MVKECLINVMDLLKSGPRIRKIVKLLLVLDQMFDQNRENIV